MADKPKRKSAMKKGMKQVGGRRKNKELPKNLPERTLKEVLDYRARQGRLPKENDDR
jgi:hypothetical protein